MSTKKKSGSSRATKAKQKAAYVSDEEEEAFTNNYDILDKLESKKFPKYFIQEMTGEEVTLEHFQRQGFNTPLFVQEKSGKTASSNISPFLDIFGWFSFRQELTPTTATNLQVCT